MCSVVHSITQSPRSIMLGPGPLDRDGPWHQTWRHVWQYSKRLFVPVVSTWQVRCLSAKPSPTVTLVGIDPWNSPGVNKDLWGEASQFQAAKICLKAFFIKVLSIRKRTVLFMPSLSIGRISLNTVKHWLHVCVAVISLHWRVITRPAVKTKIQLDCFYFMDTRLSNHSIKVSKQYILYILVHVKINTLIVYYEADFWVVSQTYLLTYYILLRQYDKLFTYFQGTWIFSIKNMAPVWCITYYPW